MTEATYNAHLVNKTPRGWSRWVTGEKFQALCSHTGQLVTFVPLVTALGCSHGACTELDCGQWC